MTHCSYIDPFRATTVARTNNKSINNQLSNNQTIQNNLKRYGPIVIQIIIDNQFLRQNEFELFKTRPRDATMIILIVNKKSFFNFDLI